MFPAFITAESTVGKNLPLLHALFCQLKSYTNSLSIISILLDLATYKIHVTCHLTNEIFPAAHQAGAWRPGFGLAWDEDILSPSATKKMGKGRIGPNSLFLRRGFYQGD